MGCLAQLNWKTRVRACTPQTANACQTFVKRKAMYRVWGVDSNTNVERFGGSLYRPLVVSRRAIAFASKSQDSTRMGLSLKGRGQARR